MRMRTKREVTEMMAAHERFRDAAYVQIKKAASFEATAEAAETFNRMAQAISVLQWILGEETLVHKTEGPA